MGWTYPLISKSVSILASHQTSWFTPITRSRSIGLDQSI